MKELEILNEIRDKFFKKEGGSISGDFGLYRRLGIIETALKDYITQKQRAIIYEKVIEERDKFLEKHNVESLNELNEKLENCEEHEQILKDYGFSLANFREACFTLAQFRGEGFTGIEKQINKLRKLRENIKALESRAFYDANSNSDRMCYSIVLKNGKREYISRDLYKLLEEICYND